MKTTEEKRASVLAECERVCPEMDQVEFIEEIAATLQRCQFETRQESVYELIVGGRTVVVWEGMDNIEVARVYRLLGLDARNAVSELREESDKYFTELQAENQRLREFAELCKKSPEKLVKTNFFENGEFDYTDLVTLQDAAELALSPAPVTETTTEFKFQNRPQDTTDFSPKNKD